MDSYNDFSDSIDSRLFSASNLLQSCSNCALCPEPNDERCLSPTKEDFAGHSIRLFYRLFYHNSPVLFVSTVSVSFSPFSAFSSFSPLQDLVIRCASTSFPAPGLKQSTLGVRKSEDDLRRSKTCAHEKGGIFLARS